MVKVKEDLTGKQFGTLTVVCQVDDYVRKNGQRSARWLLRCSCGNETVVRGDALKRGEVKSCKDINKHHNVYDLTGEYGVCTVKDGTQFIFDLADYELIKQYTWHISKNGYVVSKEFLLHRLVMNAPKDMFVDHKDGNKLDNRKSELRICTVRDNSRNIHSCKNNTSGYKGVVWDKDLNKWRAQIKVDYKTVYLGVFDDIENAAIAYDDAAKKCFGAFAKLNFEEAIHS